MNVGGRWIGASAVWHLMHGILDGRAHRRGDPDGAPRRSHVVVMPTHEVSDARHLKCVEGLYSPDVACATCVSWIGAVMPRAMATRQGLHEGHLQTQATQPVLVIHVRYMHT